MARYVKDIQAGMTETVTIFLINDFMVQNGFKYVERDGEPCFRAIGASFWLPKYFKWDYKDGVVHLEAWTEPGWFSKGRGENAMTGNSAWFAKRAYKKRVDMLAQILDKSFLLEGIPEQKKKEEEEPLDPEVEKEERRFDTASFICGFIGLIMIGIPYLSVAWGILALFAGIMGSKSRESFRVIMGMMYGCVGIVVGVILISLNFMEIVYQGIL